MKAILSKATNAYKQFPFIITTILFLLVLSSCNDDDTHNDTSIECKNRPDRITFGRDANDMVYNAQDQLIKITSADYDITSPSAPPVITVYTIDYNTQGKANKVSKSVDNQLEVYYELEYNTAGKITEQAMFNAQGILVATTTAQYNSNGVLSSITTINEGTSIEVTSSYEYVNGNLVKKSVQNLYDLDSQEYYTADYTYSYFDIENKVEPYFEGPLGLLFISNLSNQQALQYLPKNALYQLFFAQETPLETKMLKNIEIIAHRYNTSDTTHIDYSYDYDADGFPKAQRGNYKNVTRRNVPSPFGGSVLLVTPTTNSFESTLNFSCN